jgi:tRNA G46 methylase TrmB
MGRRVKLGDDAVRDSKQLETALGSALGGSKVPDIIRQSKGKSMRLQNAITAIKQPHIIGQYAIWSVHNLLSRKRVTKRVRRSLSIGGFSGFSEYLAVDDFLKDGDFSFFQEYSFAAGAFVDIGANMGVYSLVFAQRFPDRPIYAVEANPQTLATLRKNIELNGAENVISAAGV